MDDDASVGRSAYAAGAGRGRLAGDLRSGGSCGRSGSGVGPVHGAEDRAADGFQQRFDGRAHRPEARLRTCHQAHQCSRRCVRQAGGDGGRRHHGRPGDGGCTSSPPGRCRGRARDSRSQLQRQCTRNCRTGDRAGRRPHHQLLGDIAEADRGGGRRLPVSDRAVRCLAGAGPGPRHPRAGLRQRRPAVCRRRLGAGPGRCVRGGLGWRAECGCRRTRPSHVSRRVAQICQRGRASPGGGGLRGGGADHGARGARQRPVRPVHVRRRRQAGEPGSRPGRRPSRRHVRHRAGDRVGERSVRCMGGRIRRRVRRAAGARLREGGL